MCKPGTVGDYDPLTGVNYRTEIEANIKTQGFFPIDTSDLKPFKEGSVTNPASDHRQLLRRRRQDPHRPRPGTGPVVPPTAGNGIPTGETNCRQ